MCVVICFRLAFGGQWVKSDELIEQEGGVVCDCVSSLPVLFHNVSD